MKKKSQIMYKFIFNKKLVMLFKNRKRIRTRLFLALQIHTKQMLKYLTIFQNSGFLNLKHDIYFIINFLRGGFKCIKVHGDPDKKNETFVKYWSLYLPNTDCKTVRLNATENPLFQPFKI